MDWKRKLTSRKFWAAVVNFITQIMICMKMPENEVAQVAAVVMAGAGVIAYIVGEGMIDAAGTDPAIHDTEQPPDVPSVEE